MRRTLKNRLAKLEKQSTAPKVEVLWVDVDSGETHEGALKARYGDQMPLDVEPITVSWMHTRIFVFLYNTTECNFIVSSLPRSSSPSNSSVSIFSSSRL